MPRLNSLTNQLFQNSGIRRLALYTLLRSTASVNEGNSFTITFITAQTGSFAYTITGVTSADISGASLTGSVTNGTVLTYNVTADAATEGVETFTITLNNGLATTSVIINDTSTSDPSVTSFFGATGESVIVSSPRLSLITTAQSRFGTRSLQKTPINGSGNSANAVNIPLSQTIGAPLTVEAWVWIGTGWSSPNFELGPNLLLHGPAVDVATNFPTNFISMVGYGTNVSGITAQTGVSRIPPDGTGSATNDQNNSGIPLNTWTHIALGYSNSTNCAVWVNGIRRLRPTWGAGYGLSATMTQLTLNPNGNVGPHYIDEIRVSNIDRYGVDNTTLTIPTAEFISDANTVALVKFE
jgi:hypothetical protein